MPDATDPAYQAGFAAAVAQAAALILAGAEALAGTGGAAVGEMPAAVPASVLGDLYASVAAIKPPEA